MPEWFPKFDPNSPPGLPVVNVEPNELLFVDADIRAEYEGKPYLMGVPAQLQLARNIGMLADLLGKQLVPLGFADKDGIVRPLVPYQETTE